MLCFSMFRPPPKVSRRLRGDSFLGLGLLKTVQKICCLLSMRRCGEDRALVVLQHLQPALDVGGMVGARLGGEPKVCAKKRCAKLCNQLFLCISFVAPSLAAKITVKAAFVFGPVGKLMGKG
jgi:hypothetical protein